LMNMSQQREVNHLFNSTISWDSSTRGRVTGFPIMFEHESSTSSSPDQRLSWSYIYIFSSVLKTEDNFIFCSILEIVH
jgi:hypothetical protein